MKNCLDCDHHIGGYNRDCDSCRDCGGRIDYTKKPDKKRCGVKGCKKEHHSSDFCIKHYGSNRYYRINGIVCKYKECSEAVFVEGFCEKHYYNHEDYETVRLCKRRGCKEKHYAKGFCKKHYAQFVYKKKKNISGRSVKWNNTICSVDGCLMKARVKGMCKNHYCSDYKKRKNAANQFNVLDNQVKKLDSLLSLGYSEVATIQLAKESRESIALAIPEKMLLGINPEEQVFGHSIKKVG